MKKQSKKPSAKRVKIPTEMGKSGLTPTFSDRPIGYGNPPRETQIKTGEIRNPGGRPRPKILSDAYRKMLATVNVHDPLGRTNAEIAAEAIKPAMLQGDIPTLRELRSATEGERTRTIEDDIIDYLREGRLTPAQVREALPDDADRLIIAAGLGSTTSAGTGEAQAPGARPDAGGG